MLLMLMLRNVLTTVWCRFGSRNLVKNVIFVQTLSTRFAQDIKVDVPARSILLLILGKVMKLMLGRGSEARFGLVLILKLGLVKVLKFKFS